MHSQHLVNVRHSQGSQLLQIPDLKPFLGFCLAFSQGLIEVLFELG